MLTDVQARKAEPGTTPYKIGDSGGLYLYVAPTGLKSWRMKFRFQGKEKLLTFGPYPQVTISEARRKRDEARAQLREQIDPSGARERARQNKAQAQLERARDLTFEHVGRAWHELQKVRWTEVHANDVITSLERDVFPDLGLMLPSEIDAPTVLATLRKVEARGAIETAHRLRQRISAIFVYAISESIVSGDPAATVAKALRPMPTKKRQPALVKLDELQAVLRDAEAADASAITKLASRLLALTAVRPE